MCTPSAYDPNSVVQGPHHTASQLPRPSHSHGKLLIVCCCLWCMPCSAKATAVSTSSSSTANSSSASTEHDSSSGHRDAAFAQQVGQAVVDWILDKLSDYHYK